MLATANIQSVGLSPSGYKGNLLSPAKYSRKAVMVGKLRYPAMSAVLSSFFSPMIRTPGGLPFLALSTNLESSFFFCAVVFPFAGFFEGVDDSASSSGDVAAAPLVFSV